eukprot:TRINITY_DN830_c0_g1_i1.p1 TRINITY_DN830_c0_g1~~TRINITY_DN830_c0_g1_i1.p1  ORF type:complete len:523 (-),score=125.47 TRINITY_DN830_c0_g1_i1:36-1604(-)
MKPEEGISGPVAGHDGVFTHGALPIQMQDGEMRLVRPTCLKLHRMNLGISTPNMLTCYAGAMFSVCFFVFMNACQPFVLENFLHTPDDSRGTVSGNLAFYSELMILISSNIWGSLSDKIGRRIVYVAGMAFAGLGFALYPFATAYWQLIIFRLVFAVGASACAAMLSAVLGDYVFVEDRGTGSGLLGLSAGFGAVLGALVFLQFPDLLHQKGLDLELAGKITYFTVAFVAVIGGVVMWVGLRKRTKATAFQAHNSMWTIIKEGFFAGKNPVLSLAYGSGFAARGDSSIATTFLTLWVFQAATAQGLSSAQALSRAGVVSGVAQTCGLFFSPIAGILCSKLHRVLAMVILATVAAIGYTMICLSNDALGVLIMVGACVVGCGEIGLVVSSTALVAQESPPLIRGSTSGFFSFCGAVGILVATKVGGVLFDQWRPSGPFLLFGVFNAFLALWGVAVYIYVRMYPERQAAYAHVPPSALPSSLPSPANGSEGLICPHAAAVLTVDDDLDPTDPNVQQGETTRLVH